MKTIRFAISVLALLVVSVSAQTPRAITPADIHYLGILKVPGGDGPQQAFYYSKGALAIRYQPDGSFTFLMTGPGQEINGWWQFPTLREFTYPGESLDEAAAPMASIVRDYADIYQGKQLVKTPSDGGPRTYGIWFDSIAQVLWSTYQTPYNIDNNPSLLATRFNADGSTQTFGPWRLNVHSGKVGGFITPIPEAERAAFGGRTHVLGAPPRVQNSVTAFGGELNAVTLPALDAPADTVDGGAAVTVLPLLDYDIQHPQPRDVSGMRLTQAADRWDGVSGAPVTMPFFSGQNPGAAALLDWMDTAAWVDTGTVRGVIQFGQLVDAIVGGPTPSDNWYGGSSDQFGQVDPTHPSTGPGAGSLASQFWMWDPADLMAVASGHKDIHTVLPTATGRVQSLPGASSIDEGMRGSGGKYRWGQMVVEPRTGKMFLTEYNRDHYGCCTGVPRIHVFQIGGGGVVPTPTPTPAPPPPPPPPAPAPLPDVSIAYSKCAGTVTVTAKGSPDGTTGWTMRLRVGTEIRSAADKTAPYVLSATVTQGTPVAVVWTKGQVTRVQDLGPASCGVAAT